jgi:cell wall assembly regulator SMI1
VDQDVAGRVGRSWGEVLAWCRLHAPATAAAIRGPADDAALRDAQAEMGVRWPQELLAWLRLTNGAEPSLDGQMIPVFYAPLGVEEIVGEWKMLTASTIPAEEVLAATAQPAGSDCSAFLPSWIPIATDFCGGYLFADLRSGARHGCIGEWYAEEGFSLGPTWDDIVHMLDTVAFALRAGHAGDWDPDMRAEADNGRLTWVRGP